MNNIGPNLTALEYCITKKYDADLYGNIRIQSNVASHSDRSAASGRRLQHEASSHRRGDECGTQRHPHMERAAQERSRFV